MNKIVVSSVCLGVTFCAGIGFDRAWAPRPLQEAVAGPLKDHSDRVDRGKSRPGGEAITTAAGLRELFKSGGSNGRTKAQAALGGMHASEVAALVHDLAAAQATTPGYEYTFEISTACARWAEVDPKGALQFVLQSKQKSFRDGALASVFSGMAVNDPAMAKAEAAAITDPVSRRLATIAVAGALAVKNPDDWVEMVNKDHSLGSFTSIRSITSEWANDDPVAAAGRLENLPASMRKGAAGSIAKIWGSKDAPAALAWASSLKSPAERTEALGAVVGGMSAKDPEAAMAAMATLPPAARKAGLKSVFTTLADTDFKGAVARASALTDPADQHTALESLVTSTERYSSDPTSLLSLLPLLPEGKLRDNALESMGTSLVQYSKEDSEALMAGCSDADREKINSQLQMYLGWYDPERALGLYDSQSPDQNSNYSFRQIISKIASSDPEKAFQLALSRKAPGEQEQGMRSAFSQLAASDPVAAQAHLAELPPGPVRTAAVVALSASWADADPAAAKAWANGLAGEEKQMAITAITPAIAQTDPKGAAAMLLPLAAAADAETQNETLNSAVQKVCGAWSAQDPAATSSWISSLPDGLVKAEAVSSIASTWCTKDPEAAAKWVDSLPPGKARDAGATGIVSSVYRGQPATAFQWAAGIGDDQQRTEALSEVVSGWKATDPVAARDAVDAANLSEKDQADLLKVLNAKGVTISSRRGYDPFE